MRDMLRLWPALRFTDVAGTYPAWFVGVSTLVARNRAATTLLAGQYLEAFHTTAGAGTGLVVVPAEAAPLAQVAISMRVTSTIAYGKGRQAGLTGPEAAANALVRASGAATRLVLDAGRDTVRQTTVADPKCIGWRRVGRGRCDFCRMLIGRGAVYRESTAQFQAHDHCTCSAEPVYR